MDGLLSSLAIVVMLAGGLGATLLLFGRGKAFDFLELFSLSVFAGTTSIAVSLFLLGYFLRHPFLTIAVTIIQAALLAAGIKVWRSGGVRIVRWHPVESTTVALVLAGHALLLAWIALHEQLGWDGMVIWEFKAHLIAVNHGHLPVSHINDRQLLWTHNAYPLFFPLNKAWLYLWMGDTNQQLSKLPEVLWFLAAASQVYSGVRRLTGSVAGAAAGLFVLFALPAVYGGAGSVGTGLADLPLAAFYVAAVRYVAAYSASGSRDDLMLAGSLAAAGCWIKQDGTILWLVVTMLLVVLTGEWRARWRWLVAAAAPGAAVVVAWKLFRMAIKVQPEGVYMPATIFNFLAHSDRLWPTFLEMMHQLSEYKTWNLLWYAVPVAAIALFLRSARRQSLVLLAAVATPMALFCCIYVFTNWSPPILHVQNSLVRLLVSPALVGTLFAGVSAGHAFRALRNPLTGHRRQIAVLTDFGTSDPYVASMKGVIAARTDAPVVDLAHDIRPQDVFGAAWFLRTAERWWPRGTIFVAVVDPGVGTSRRILVLARDGKIYIAPDNGLLTFVADGATVRSVENDSHFLPGGSNTFHGRDRLAPLAAAVANGVPLDVLGPIAEDIVTVADPAGSVVAIDRFGNVITNVELPGDRVSVKVGKTVIGRVCRTYAEGGKEPFIIVGSNGTIEISVRNGSAAEVLHVHRGDPVKIVEHGTSRA